jgi:hypothetical protein
MGAVTVIPVPRSRRTTPPRSTQIDDVPWFRFGAAAHVLGMSRAGLMKQLVLWFIRWPGIKLPARLTEDEMSAAEVAFKVVETERERRLSAPTAEQQERTS